MLSELSYRQLRFEGRPQRRPVAAAVLADHAAAPPAGILRRTRREEPELAADEQRLVAAALAAAGLDPAAYRSGPFRRRLPALVRSLRAGHAAAAASRLAGDRSLAVRALDTLLIGHTEPFRDAEAFAALRERVLPALAAGRTGLRVWSVGCSTGVELLSVGLLLAEMGVIAGSRLRGSDCRSSAIAAAKTQALARVLAAGHQRFGRAEASIAPPEFLAAADRIEWCVEDALVAEPRGPWDVILCRNLSIYLDDAASRALWDRLGQALAPGGVLVTGKAERPPGELPLTRLAKCIYRREGGAA